MSYVTRKDLLKRISEKRGRDLISYVTSIRPNMSGNMAGDAIFPVIEQLENITTDKKEVDFLIISNGGDPITSLRIMSLLRERFDKISVLLPYVAYSAATILALGADEIIMHPYSNLGPVDPQLTVSHNNEKGIRENMQFSSEDLRNYVEFIKTDVGITDQQHLVSAISPLLKDVGTLPIGTAKRSQQLSLTLSEKMLGWHFKDSTKAKSIAKALNSSYYHHGYAVGRKEAKEIGLPVVIPEKELETLLWTIWKDYSDEMKCSIAFDPVREIMTDPESNAIISQVPVVNLPANTPPDVANQIIIQRAQQTPVTTRLSLKRRNMIAAVESAKISKAFFNDINLIYWRNPDFSLGVNCTVTPSGWIDNSEVKEKNDGQ